MKMQKRNFVHIAVAVCSLGVSATVHAYSGEKVYQNQCSACHGTSGQGDGPAGAQLTPKPTPFKSLEKTRFEKAIFAGVNNAPGHGVAALLTPAERAELIEYSLKLAK